jgi:hypothetical protein
MERQALRAAGVVCRACGGRLRVGLFGRIEPESTFNDDASIVVVSRRADCGSSGAGYGVHDGGR